MSTGRNTILDRLALGYDCPRCSAYADEPCQTPNGAPTAPHTARIDKAVARYQKANAR